MHVLLLVFDGGKQQLSDFVQEDWAPLINSKAIGKLTISTVLLPRNFSKVDSNKHFRGATFAKVLESSLKDNLTHALSIAPVIAEQVAFKQMMLGKVVETKLE
jgi:hypothetical protein